MSDPVLPPALLHPEMMVIGDSLAQGCRSLTVSRDLCAQSWGSRVAAAQGWRFSTPDLPRPVLFDLEDEVRRLGDFALLSTSGVQFGGIVTRLMANLRAWLANRPASTHVAFDNLGLSGAQPCDLYARTAATSQAEITRILPNNGAGQILLHRGEIGALHLAINGRYTLNPSQDARFAGFTPLDWVRARLPRRLFMQIGHNNGLYAIGSSASDKPFDAPNDNGDGFYASFERLGAELAALPADVGLIACLLLPRVGAVANLRPRSAVRDAKGYAESYEPVFATTGNTFTGARMAEIDAAIHAANDKIRATLTTAAEKRGNAGRLRFFDSFAMFGQYDFKNSLNPARRIPLDGGHAIDNDYVAGKLIWQVPFPPGTPPYRKELAGGGFQSIDGMHPTACGYAVLAHELMKGLGLKDPGLPTMLHQGFVDDNLLHDYPLKLDRLVQFFGLLRLTHQHGVRAPEPKQVIAEGEQDLHVQDAVSLIKELFNR